MYNIFHIWCSDIENNSYLSTSEKRYTIIFWLAQRNVHLGCPFSGAFQWKSVLSMTNEVSVCFAEKLVKLFCFFLLLEWHCRFPAGSKLTFTVHLCRWMVLRTYVKPCSRQLAPWQVVYQGLGSLRVVILVTRSNWERIHLYSSPYSSAQLDAGGDG